MNIFDIKMGDKLVFLYPTSGYYADQEQVKDWPIGRVLTVARIEIHNWNTDIWFKEVEGKYNSVHFGSVSIGGCHDDIDYLEG